MEKLIELARNLGTEIQKQEMFIDLMAKKKIVEEDTNLQENISLYNLKRLAINNEVAKAEKDPDKIKDLTEELRVVYGEVINNQNMIALESVKAEATNVIQRIVAIITQCAEGEDPKTTDYHSSDCGGGCSTCSGC